MTAAKQKTLALPSPTQRQVAIDVRSIALALIAPDPAQPRKEFDGPALAELAESIKGHGVLQPILVRPVPASRPASVPKECQYLVIAGERRFRACHLAGMDEIPAQVRDDLTGDEIAVVQVLENLQRRDLSFAETARGVALLVEKIGNSEAARQLGKDPGWVSRHASVLKLRKAVVDLVKEGLIESVDIAHELDTLFDLSQERGQQLAREFRDPPHWRGTPPTRQAIRSAIDVEKQRIQSEKARAEEQARANAQRHILDTAEQYGGGVARAKESDDEDEHEEQGGTRRSPVEDHARKNQIRSALRAQAVEIATRLTAQAMAALGAVEVPGTDPCRYAWHGREFSVGDLNGEFPVEVVQNYIPWDQEASIETQRYSLCLELPGLTAAEVPEFVTRFAGGTATADRRYEQPGLRDLHRFVEEFTQPSPGESVRNDWLFEQYGKWCKRHKLTPLSNQHFGEALPRLGYEKVRKEAGRSYLNIAPKGKA